MLDTAGRVSDEAKADELDDAEPQTSAAEAREAPKPVDTDALSPELLALLRKVVPAAWLLGVIGAGVLSGIELALLVLAAGVLTLVITLMWSSVQSLTGGSSLGLEEALGMGAPSKVEEEKRAVLRALKDLEYERGVGKITPEDYAELVAKYRADAKRLMQSVDEKLEPARAQVEQQLAERLDREGLKAPVALEAKSEEPAAAADSAAEAAAPDAEEIAEKAAETAEKQPTPPEEKS